MVGSIGLSRFHDQRAQPFPLGHSDAHKLQSELVLVYPAYNRLADPQRPLKIREEDREAQLHADLHRNRRVCAASASRNVEQLSLALEFVVPKEEEAAGSPRF